MLKGLIFGIIFWVISAVLSFGGNLVQLGVADSLIEVALQLVVNLTFGYLLVSSYGKLASRGLSPSPPRLEREKR